MRLVCPECDKKLAVKDELRGKRIKCPGCSTAFAAVPADEARPKKKVARQEEDEEEDQEQKQEQADDEEEDRPSSRAKRRKADDEEDDPKPKKRKLKPRSKDEGKKKLFLWLGIGGGVVAAGVVTLILVLGNSGKDKKGGNKDGGKGPDNTRPPSASLVELTAFQVDRGIVGVYNLRGFLSADNNWVVLPFVHEQAEAVNRVRIIDLQGKQLISTLTLKASGLPPVALSPNKSLLAVPGTGFGSTIELYNPQTGAVVKTLEPQAKDLHDVKHLAFTPAGDLLIAAGDKSVTAWDVRSGTRKYGWKTPESISGLAISVDGKTIVTTAWDGIVTVWNVSTQSEVRTVRLPERRRLEKIALSPNGKLLACLDEPQRRTSIVIVDLDTGNTVKDLQDTYFSRETRFTFLNDNKTIVTSGEVDLIVWDIESGEKKLTQTNQNDLSGFRVRALSPTGTLVGLNGWSVKVWDVKQ